MCLMNDHGLVFTKKKSQLIDFLLNLIIWIGGNCKVIDIFRLTDNSSKTEHGSKYKK